MTNLNFTGEISISEIVKIVREQATDSKHAIEIISAMQSLVPNQDVESPLVEKLHEAKLLFIYNEIKF